MIPNLLCCLILRQLRTHGMLNKIVNPSNNICIVCFPCIYQSNISFLSNLRYHIGSTNISLHLFTLKEISHYITPIRIVLPIQPHTHRLNWIISFSSNNQQLQRTRMQKQRKTKYQITKTEQISQNLNKYLLEVIWYSKTKNYRNKTQISSYRNWKEDEIPSWRNWREDEKPDLQKLKGRWNARFAETKRILLKKKPKSIKLTRLCYQVSSKSI